MKRMTVTALLLFLATTMGALGSEVPRLCGVAYHPGDMLDGYQNVATRGDTLWFGGDDGSGIAVADEYWDFEDGTLQGCFSTDETANPGDYFEWTTAATFTAHGDPVIPLIEIGGEPTVGQIWCGIHEDEAAGRDFISGMGYQNEQCQRAFSPEFVVGIGEAPSIEFDFFCQSEPGYDFTRVYILGFDGGGAVLVEEELAVYDGATGDEAQPWTTPVLDEFLSVPAGLLDGAASFQFEFRMTSDEAWSDEDGLWDSPGGPFALDNAEITYSGGIEAYDFDAGAEGWTFERCAGVGAYLHLVDESEYTEWLDQLNLTCTCTLSGRAAGFTGTVDPLNNPALVPGQRELFQTGVLPRGFHQPPEWNGVLVEWDSFVHLPQCTGSRFRPGYRFYPYTSEANPTPHWSPYQGQTTWFYTNNSYCALDRRDMIALGAETPVPLPVDWDSLRFCYEVVCSCDGFGVPSTACTEEGWTLGSPLIDNIRLGLYHAPDAPVIGWMDGGLLADAFGQNFPTYLEPSDRCNSNASLDLSMGNVDLNDWLADTTAVGGPTVNNEEDRWLAEFCFRVARKGARQDMIPEYINWRGRFTSDPEVDFVAVLMDSCMQGSLSWKNKFCTFIHESDPAFDPQYPPQCDENEILPDGAFVPGTRIEYYARAFWYNGGAPPDEYHSLGDADHPKEFECLPTMIPAAGDDYAVEWPAVLYLDAYNRGAERHVTAALEELGISYDKVDWTAGCCGDAKFGRTYGLGGFNPGGWGNNGCTIDQLIGYRLIILNTGTSTAGAIEPLDIEFFEEWLSYAECGLGDTRRGFVFDGDQIARVIKGEGGQGLPFLNNTLGVTLPDDPYHAFNEDPAYCVYLEPATGAVFAPAAPGVSLYGNGCPDVFDFSVLWATTGVSGALGNLSYYSYEHTGLEDYVDFAQIVREKTEPGVANWRTVVNGFSMHHLSERGCGGEDCSNDSACIVAGIIDLLAPQLEWMSDPQAPFVAWGGACTSEDAEPEYHLAGPVNHLYAARPNPFHASATIRFSLAQRGHVTIEVFDVTGRLKRTVVDGVCDAGEHALAWDGTDNSGNRAGAGLYWTQMRTEDGYISSRRLIRLR